jgi:hypothetical protein
VTEYHVVMLSGGELRHYEVMADSHGRAYAEAQKEDARQYYGQHDALPDATVIHRASGMAENF